MLPFTERRTELTGQMSALNSGGDYSRARELDYLRLENQRDILDSDVRTTLPPHLSDTGHFEPGDLHGYLDERSGGAFDDMPPDQQRSYIQQLRPEYEQQRAQDAARRDGESRVAGPAGRVLGEVLAMGVGLGPLTIGRRPWAPGRASRCQTCTPGVRPTPREPEITMYRGIQVVRGQPVDGTRPGQMASTDPRDALHYGLNPPGARPPAGANELVLMRFRVPVSRAYDPDPRPAPSNATQHLIIERGVDVTKLPGYTEYRLPLSHVGSAPDAERLHRTPNEPAVARWAERLRAP